MATLAGLLEHRDAVGFVGRAVELDALSELFTNQAHTRVVHLYGPGGVGKSALLRELARRGSAQGWTPHILEGRELIPTPDGLEAALAGIDETGRHLLLFDTYERISGLDGLLRREVLRRLSAETRVVFAGRRAPAPGWSEDGWETVTHTLELGPLSSGDAEALLAACGVPSARAPEIAAAGGGSPLALRLLASADGGRSDVLPGADSQEIIGTLVRRLTDAEVDPHHHDVLAIAAVARVTTLDLLGDVLPDHDAEQALSWLASRSFAEPLAGGFVLHDLVKRAARADIRRRDPEREHRLRRRIADHLHPRAVGGDLTLSIDLAHLIDDPILRWGYSWEGTDVYHADSLRPGDLDAVSRRLGREGQGGWWTGSESIARVAPSRAAVVRDVSEDIVGLAVAVTPGNAPAMAWEHTQLGPWLHHARDVLRTGEAVISQGVIDLTQDPRHRVQAMLGMIVMLRSGLSNPRYAYMPVDPALSGAVAFAEAVGARHLPELDVELARTRLECHLLDYGPGGLLGFQRDAVYRETGLEPVRHDPGVLAQAVQDALRRYQRPDELAHSPLASGIGPADRASSVRAVMLRAVNDAFGDTSDERLLRAVIVQGYMTADNTHEGAADNLNVSRATYFRKLRTATQRMCDHISTGRS